MKDYKNQYTKIDKRTIEEIRKTIKQGLFKVEKQERLKLLNALNDRLSSIYKLKFKPIINYIYIKKSINFPQSL